MTPCASWTWKTMSGCTDRIICTRVSGVQTGGKQSSRGEEGRATHEGGEVEVVGVVLAWRAVRVACACVNVKANTLNAYCDGRGCAPFQHVEKGCAVTMEIAISVNSNARRAEDRAIRCLLLQRVLILTRARAEACVRSAAGFYPKLTSPVLHSRSQTLSLRLSSSPRSSLPPSS